MKKLRTVCIILLKDQIAFENNWLKHTHCDGTGCLIWDAGKDKRGYGYVYVDRNSMFAHRWMFEKFRHSLNPNLELNHICNKSSCMNPWHLEEVSHSRNMKYSFETTNRRVGQEYITENTTYFRCGHEFLLKNIGVNKKGNKFCRACHRLHNKNNSRNRKK